MTVNWGKQCIFFLFSVFSFQSNTHYNWYCNSSFVLSVIFFWILSLLLFVFTIFPDFIARSIGLTLSLVDSIQCCMQSIWVTLKLIRSSHTWQIINEPFVKHESKCEKTRSWRKETLIFPRYCRMVFISNYFWLKFTQNMLRLLIEFSLNILKCQSVETMTEQRQKDPS